MDDGRDCIPLAELAEGPFMLLEKGEKAEISELFESNGLVPNVVFTTWDDYAIMSMVENGLGVSILPELILRRIPYRIAVLPLDVPAYRYICLVMRDRSKLPVAAKNFVGYLKYRQL
ncbi:MAG: LysR family transcriptional regulator substrate-binding protein [Candidatus Methanomethylophilaceae archaeon]|nr:LysR family transcriptional regulator substrate-binding protein [Candidatus Methanomethylophilaceae archaeon]